MQEAVAWMVTLNARAAHAMTVAGAHAATDVTGFGLLGHAGEMAVASGVALRIDSAKVPVLSNAIELIERNVIPGGTHDNAAVHADFTTFQSSVSPALRLALSDAQTSGGLLISLAPEDFDTFAREMQGANALLAVIGEVGDGGGITVR
jgi:selenide,water dikinase